MSNVFDFKRIWIILAQSLFVYMYMYVFSKSLSLFIEDLRDVGNHPAHQLVLTEALIFHHWSFAWFEDCPMKKKFKSIPIRKGTMSANIVVILVLYRRHNAEMVVAETVTPYFSFNYFGWFLSISFIWNIWFMWFIGVFI